MGCDKDTVSEVCRKMATLPKSDKASAEHAVNFEAELEEFGCFRLAARIHDLGKAGYHVLVEMVMANGKRHAVYRLAMPQRQARLF